MDEGSDGVAARCTVVIVNFRTLEHTRRCVETLRDAYPDVPIVLVDNGSGDGSTEYIRSRAAEDPHTEAILNAANAFHGPALHQGMLASRTTHVLTLDSDCEITRPGFLELMLAAFDREPRLYAIGKRGWTNRYGYAPISTREPRTHYVHPFAGMIDRGKYATLRAPFVHHGAPAYRHMWAAARAGFVVEHFMIEDYLVHHRRVTATRFGYGFDRRLKLQARLNDVDHRARRLTARLTGRPLRPPPLPPATTGEAQARRTADPA